MKNANIVNELMVAWNAMDMERIMDCFTDDAVYTNIPIDPPNQGKAAIREFIEGFIGTMGGIEFVVHNQIENADGVVMNERTDKIKLGDKLIELPVMGVFEIRDGRISAWRDYFDMQQFA